MDASCLLLFFRISVGLVFLFSFVGKVQDIRTFIRTISTFRLFPQSFSQPLAYMILLGAMLLGGKFLFWGFLIASKMLLAFTIAIASALARKIKTACNCFGTGDNEISNGHVIRNIGFLFCGLPGLAITAKLNLYGQYDFFTVLIIGIAAIIFIAIWTNISDILKLFHFAR